jgi:competence protein ComGF
MDIRQSEQGFTFLSLLLTATILFMTIPLVTYLVKAADYSSHYQEMSIQQFFYYLRDDVMKATTFAIPSSTVLKLGNSDDITITIEQYKDLVRRRVKVEGHEIYLRDVADISFRKVDYGVRATVTSLQGETYEKTIILYQ